MPFDDLIERGGRKAIYDVLYSLLVMLILFFITRAMEREDLSNLVMLIAGFILAAYTISNVVSYAWSRKPYLEILTYFTILIIVSYFTKIDDPAIYVLGTTLLLFRAIEKNRYEYAAIILMVLLLLWYLLSTHPQI